MTATSSERDSGRKEHLPSFCPRLLHPFGVWWNAICHCVSLLCRLSVVAAALTAEAGEETVGAEGD